MLKIIIFLMPLIARLLLAGAEQRNSAVLPPAQKSAFSEFNGDDPSEAARFAAVRQRIVQKTDCEILFAEHYPGRDASSHYYANFGYSCVDENVWLHGIDGGRLAIINPKTGRVRTLIEDAKGSFRDPVVHYDAQKVLFAYRKGGHHQYNLYEIDLDGSNLRQLTSGNWDDIEPAYLPDGKIVFCSSRCKRYVICWLAPVATLFRCNADGSDIRAISSSSLVENTPALLPDGRILFTRWEYVNRDAVSFHHLWTMNPDGTGSAAFYGNMHPGGLFSDGLPIPGSDKIVYVDSGYHGGFERSGKVLVLSAKNGPDDRSQVKLVAAGGIRNPYPLSDSEFLAARQNELVFIADKSGVQPFYKSSSQILVYNPKLITVRPREAIIPTRVNPKKTTGTLMLFNTYVGRNLNTLKPGSVKKLLVMEQLPKPANYHGGGTTPIAHGGKWSLNRILGTVPVETDGSACFDIPACRSIYLALMDESDRSIKQMRAFITVQPGEYLSCVGCHENRTVTPSVTNIPLATKRPPSKIEPIPGTPEIIDFPRDIQPILDRHCVSCHSPDKRDGGIDLCGDRGPTYSISYYNLILNRQIKDTGGLHWAGEHNIGGRPAGNDAPYVAFSSAAPLMKIIDGSHHQTKLSRQEQTLIRLWLDSATPYAGTYAAYGTGQIGAWWRNNEPIREMANTWPSTKPTLEAITRRCLGCHDNGSIPRFVTDLTKVDCHNDMEGWMRPTFRTSRHAIFNLTRPECSLALMAPLAKSAGGYAKGTMPALKSVPANLANAPKPFIHTVIFTSKDDPDYQVLLTHLQAAKAHLEKIKRFDMPGFQPCYEYLREMKRFGVLPSDFDLKNPPAVNSYELDQKYWQLFWHTPEA